MSLPNNLNQTAPPGYDRGGDSDISLIEIVAFFQSAWKKLALAAVVGAFLGFLGWLFVAQYQAELIIDNRGGLDLVSWRALQKSLPNLADQMIDENKVSDVDLPTYRNMGEEEWWQKNIIPNFAMSKAESKDLASTAGLESAGTNILSLTITTKALTRELAVTRSRVVVAFILKGGAYLAIRSKINAMQSNVMSADAEIAKKINDTQVELQYQAQRLAGLEVLLKRFPSDQRVSSQVVDPKDSGAKYLPISTQIIAVNTEINANKEALERLNDGSQQIAILKAFLAKATPLLQDDYDGLTLTQKLLDALDELYGQAKPDDLKIRAYLDGLRSELLGIKVRFTKGLLEATAPTASKTGVMKAIVGGLFGAFFLVTLVMMGQRMWLRAKK